MAEKFGEFGTCCDATHSTNAYDFHLLMVVDEFGEGQPIGWMISNHETVQFLKHFLNGLFKTIGKSTHHGLRVI